LGPSEEFWRLLCLKDNVPINQIELKKPQSKIKNGFNGHPMRVRVSDKPIWKRAFFWGKDIKRNIIRSNFEGWRIYANMFVSESLIYLFIHSNIESKDYKNV